MANEGTGPTADEVAAAVAAEGPAIARWLPTQRWFGDKDRPIRSAGVASVADLGGEPRCYWAVLDIAFADGVAHYALPLRLGDGGVGAALLATSAAGPLADGSADPALASRPLDLLANGATLPCGTGRLLFEPFPGLAARLAAARAEPPKAGGLEQSNTAIRYGGAVLLKLFRKLQAGANPDEEIGRFLTAAGFRSVPEPLGAIRLVDGDGTATLAGFAQAFVANDGDGWGWLLDRLRAAQRDASAADDTAAAIADLGRTTAELHVALASPTADPAFAVESAAAVEIAELRASAEASMDESLAALDRRRANLGAAERAASDRVLAARDRLRARLAGFAAEQGLGRIRVHGDYHLGQTLRAAAGGWILIDFEGEPARPLAERRQKTSPLKDVAGMLNSFGYARGALLQGDSTNADALEAWENSARDAFLHAYRQAVAASAVALVPTDDVDFQRALAAWELDKALYEVRYELANRPDWLSIPLARLAAAATEARASPER